MLPSRTTKSESPTVKRNIFIKKAHFELWLQNESESLSTVIMKHLIVIGVWLLAISSRPLEDRSIHEKMRGSVMFLSKKVLPRKTGAHVSIRFLTVPSNIQ